MSVEGQIRKSQAVVLTLVLICPFFVYQNFFSAMENTNPKLLTVKEFADKARLSPAAIYQLIKNGQLDHVRIGRSIRILENRLYALETTEHIDEMNPVA